MSIVDGRWIPPFDTGDDAAYPNHHSVDELPRLAARDWDLVVVGGGGAGAVAAIEAADRGASVLVLEAMKSPGGNTQVSGGTIRLVDEADLAAEHLVQLAQNATPRPVIDSFLAGMTEIADWVTLHGGELHVRTEPSGGGHDRVFPVSRPGTSFPNFPGGEALGVRALVASRRAGRQTGAALWDLLADNLAERQIPVILGARVTRLRTDGERRVVGAEVEAATGTVLVRARRGVVLACGGYAYDEDLQTQYYGLPLPTVCLPGTARGDGVRLAADVGADLWHMNAVAASVGYRLPGLAAGIQAKMPSYGFVLLDQCARRYVCETELENHSAIFAMTAQDPITGEYLRTPSFVVFDEQTRLSGTLAHLPHGANRHYLWSKDNSAEIERRWIRRGMSLAELAEELGLAGFDLSSAVAAYNEGVVSGSDEFGRDPAQLCAIDEPPYYGAPVYPIIVNTQGGPRRDERGRVLRPDGTPVPGLFGAGELGSLWNRLYPGAGNISECLVSGRTAAASALS